MTLYDYAMVALAAGVVTFVAVLIAARPKPELIPNPEVADLAERVGSFEAQIGGRLAVLEAEPAPTPVDQLIAERLLALFVVTLKTGTSFRGLLYAVDDRVVVLRDTHALGAGPKGEHVAVDGELLLFRSDIDYLQRP